MSNPRLAQLDVLPEVGFLAEEVLASDKLHEANVVANSLVRSRQDRKWAIAKTIHEVGIHPTRPLFYWAEEMKGLPRNTRDCIRYLGDYLDLLTKEMTHELVGGNARNNSLGTNSRLLMKRAPSVSTLAARLKRYSDFLYTPGKHDFSLPPGRKHRFTPREVILTAYITSELSRRILSVSSLARIAVEKDNLYIIGGRWGSRARVEYAGDSRSHDG